MESLFRDALAHHRAGRLDEAEALYRQARDWRPAWTLGNLGVILRITGRLDEAHAVLREALAAEPGNAPVRNSLGMTLLQLHRWTEAWPFWEARRALHPSPASPAPEWRGESLKGRRLAVIAEQGFGDQILFSRFVPLLAEQAAEVTIACPQALAPLFEPLPARVIAPTSWDDVAADCWTLMGSAPGRLGAGPDDAAPIAPAAPGGSGWGLMLEGGAANPNPARVPTGGVARALRGLADFRDLSPAATGAKDFAETARIIAGLEGVVSVDTSVAHLAASLGKPTWVLLPRPALDWHTNWGDDRSPWYPTMRTFRQQRPGDWTGVLANLADALTGDPEFPAP